MEKRKIKPWAPFKYEETYEKLEKLMKCQWIPFGNYVIRVKPETRKFLKILNLEES